MKYESKTKYKTEQSTLISICLPVLKANVDG